MLTRHPDQYTDEELEAWVRHLVDEQVSEGPRLDYKETIDLNDKRELAKDISSFANEIGGTLIYGIPEDRQSDETAIPCKPYGIDPIPDIESRLENIYIDSISPRLPEWRIKKVDLTEYENKVVYVVWTPESWLGPHMVTGYRDKRYYRRGQLRVVPMEEHEIRAKYGRIRNLESAIDEFLASPELNYIRSFLTKDEFISHYVVCPFMLIPNRVNFTENDMRHWLADMYDTLGRIHPSPYGVRTDLPVSSLKSHCTEIHRNGAINQCRKTAIVRVQATECYLSPSEELRKIKAILSLASEFYKKIEYYDPLLFQLTIFSPKNRKLILYHDDLDIERYELVSHDNNLRVTISESSGKLFNDTNILLKKIEAEIYRAFGMWGND